MNWQQLCGNYHLKDLPFKKELNKFGQVVLTPLSETLSILQGQLILKLIEVAEGRGNVFSECPIKTLDNIKIVDIAWISTQRLHTAKQGIIYVIAPEICVELSATQNSDKVTLLKRKLYFEAGAKEVWVCGEDGDVIFYSQQGRMIQSVLMPNFPYHIDY